MKRAAGEYHSHIKYVEIDNDIKENLNEWGISDAIFIDKKQINTGTPPSYKKLQKLLGKKMKNFPANSV